MKKNVILSICMAFVYVVTFAQNNPTASHGQDSLIKAIPDGNHSLYTMGGKLVTPADVTAALMSYQPSAFELQKAKQNATAGFICLGASGVSGILALVEYGRDNKVANTTLEPNGTFVTVNRSKAGAEILTGVAIGTAVTAIICWVNAVRHSKHSLDLYNQHF